MSTNTEPEQPTAAVAADVSSQQPANGVDVPNEAKKTPNGSELKSDKDCAPGPAKPKKKTSFINWIRNIGRKVTPKSEPVNVAVDSATALDAPAEAAVSREEPATTVQKEADQGEAPATAPAPAPEPAPTPTPAVADDIQPQQSEEVKPSESQTSEPATVTEVKETAGEEAAAAPVEVEAPKSEVIEQSAHDEPDDSKSQHSEEEVAPADTAIVEESTAPQKLEECLIEEESTDKKTEEPKTEAVDEDKEPAKSDEDRNDGSVAEIVEQQQQ